MCHPSRFRACFIISCDNCARSHVGSFPTLFGGYRAFRCLESQKQHKPWQFEHTHVSGASLEKSFVCHPSRFRVRFIMSCDVCARSHVRSLPTSFGVFRAFRCRESQIHLTTNEVPPKGMPRRKSWKGRAVTPAAFCLFVCLSFCLVSKGECSVDTKNVLAVS